MALQETWKFDVPKNFKRQFGDRYYFVHQSAMDSSKPRGRGRPFGGLCFIISKDIAFQIIYSNSRCLSILLSSSNVIVNNIYLPYNDSRKSSEQNQREMAEALGHLEAAHELCDDSVDGITLGDLNTDPGDTGPRAELVSSIFANLGYTNNDLLHFTSQDFSHSSERLIDRIILTSCIESKASNFNIDKTFVNSDHYPVTCHFKIDVPDETEPVKKEPSLLWHKATDKAVDSYSRLSNKLCTSSLNKFRKNGINLSQLYKELVSNLETAARKCIPKAKSQARRNHDIPMWRERMSSFKNDVDYWVANQHLHGGPNRCPGFIRLQVRLAKSRYRLQFRRLKREIEINVAENATVRNCFKMLHKSSASPTPAMIEGNNKAAQPKMWHDHFRGVFKGENVPYNREILSDLDTHIENFDKITMNEINNAINDINTNKSFTRHSHWKYLNSFDHSAKNCLCEVLNGWVGKAISDDPYLDWDFFKTNVRVIPKKDKKDLSLKKSWRPISLGTSENWVLEKVFLSRLRPYLQTKDSQFGYKPKHSTSHAVELIRVIERRHDAHVCLLDASSAFDRISWKRIKDQLNKRKVPTILIKRVMTQLFSSRIIVCGTVFFYPTH